MIKVQHRTLRADGRGERFTLLEPPGVSLVRSGKLLGRRIGTVEIATAEFSGKMAVCRIESALEEFNRAGEGSRSSTPSPRTSKPSSPPSPTR